MKKKMIILLSVLLLVLTLVAIFIIIRCSGPKEEERQKMYLTASYSFVGPREDHSLVTGNKRIKNVKTDSYGRKMFTVWISSAMNFYAINCGIKDISFKPSRAMVIMQGSDDEKIYFYEDYCFLLETEEGFLQQKVDELMERNDWNKPLQPEKMSSRLSGDEFEGMTNIITVGRKEQEVIELLFPTVKVVRICPINEDYNGKVLLGINTYDEASDRFTSYFMIYDQETDVDRKENVIELTTLDFGDEMHQFKIQNNWDFIDCPGC